MTDDNGVRSADLECDQITGNNKNRKIGNCRRKQQRCSDWIQENDTHGYGWLNALPSCPCNLSEVNNHEPHWGYVPYTGHIKSFTVQDYHEGALGGCARSSTVEVGNPNPSAQQCCYDEINDTDNSGGQLITAGGAAGTPDIDAADSPALLALLDGHIASDVTPWKQCGAKIYNQIRKPNNGNNCATNVLPK